MGKFITILVPENRGVEDMHAESTQLLYQLRISLNHNGVAQRAQENVLQLIRDDLVNLRAGGDNRSHSYTVCVFDPLDYRVIGDIQSGSFGKRAECFVGSVPVMSSLVEAIVRTYQIAVTHTMDRGVKVGNRLEYCVYLRGSQSQRNCKMT